MQRQKRPARKPGRHGPKVLIAGVLALIVVVGIVTAVANPDTQLPVSSAPQVTAQGSEPVSDAPNDQTQNGQTVVGPVQQAQGQPLPTLDYRAMAVAQNGRVDMKYFETVTFVGDSITQGLQMYTQGIRNANYCAYTSIGPKGIYDGSVWPRLDGEREAPLEALVGYAPSVVYVLLGANTITNTQDEVFLTYYREMLQKMKQSLPEGTRFYIQSITPVRPSASYSMGRVDALNDALAKLAYEENAYFIDLDEALAGEDGYLRDEFNDSSDGIHLNPAGYTAWVEYLITHTVYHPSIPYLPGSPYYVG